MLIKKNKKITVSISAELLYRIGRESKPGEDVDDCLRRILKLAPREKDARDKTVGVAVFTKGQVDRHGPDFSDFEVEESDPSNESPTDEPSPTMVI